MDTLFKLRLLPAVTLNSVQEALSVAQALLNAGLDVMEVTFRTSAAARAIEAVAREFPQMHLGAGTLLEPQQVGTARDAGAQFGLSPGWNDQVVQEAQKKEFPFIPGVMTPSEIERALQYRITLLKIFPVNHLGGPSYLQSLQGPYAHKKVRFIPMGGLSLSNLTEYLDLPVVAAAGGSWITPAALIANQEFIKIGELARRSIALIQQKG